MDLKIVFLNVVLMIDLDEGVIIYLIRVLYLKVLRLIFIVIRIKKKIYIINMIEKVYIWMFNIVIGFFKILFFVFVIWEDVNILDILINNDIIFC